jgi:hypothetical protein
VLAGNGLRAAPAETVRDPRVTDRHSGAIDISPTTAPDPVATVCDNRAAYLLAELRCAALRAQLMQSDIEAVRLAIQGGLITPAQAVELLHDCDVLRYIQPTPPAIAP